MQHRLQKTSCQQALCPSVLRQIFSALTKSLAKALNLTSSDYVREAVREKNEAAMKQRIAFLSAKLSAQHLASNQAMDAATGDGLV